MTTVVVDGRLLELEKIIRRHERGFIEVGMALGEIKRKSLFRSRGYSSFPEYVQGEWNWERNYANRMIAAAKTANESVPNGTVQPPKTEAASRELAKAGTPEAVAEVWEQVVQEHGEDATAEQVEQAVIDFIEGPEVANQIADDGLLEDDLVLTVEDPPTEWLEEISDVINAAYENGWSLDAIWQRALDTIQTIDQDWHAE